MEGGAEQETKNRRAGKGEKRDDLSTLLQHAQQGGVTVHPDYKVIKNPDGGVRSLVHDIALVRLRDRITNFGPDTALARLYKWER